jgi:hypothetical protein
MSYLKGPLSKHEISKLMQDKKTQIEPLKQNTLKNKSIFKEYQALDDSIIQYFEPQITSNANYIPTICATAKVYFYNQSKGIDTYLDKSLSLYINDNIIELNWDEAIEIESNFTLLPQTVPKDARYESLPQIILKDNSLKNTKKSLIDYLYHNSRLSLYKCKSPRMESYVDESKADFVARVKNVLDDKKELELEKLQSKYESKLNRLQDRLDSALQRVEKEKNDSTSSMLEAGISILGALFGKSTPTKIGRAVSKSSKILKEKSDLSRAEQRVANIQDDMEKLEYELEDKIDKLDEKYDIDNIVIDEYAIKPKKSNIKIKDCAIVWRVQV